MPDHEAIHVLIVDDERLARQRLDDLLHDRAHVRKIGMATNGQEAIDYIRERDPDLVFLDVQMPGRNGLDVIEEIGAEKMPITIFVTAYDEYALNAFELAALDYLVKPFDDDRFEQALTRAREIMTLRDVDGITNRLKTLLDRESDTEEPGEETSTDASTDYLERIAVETKGKVRIVTVDTIMYIQADGPYAELHTPDDTHLIRERMKTLESRLNPDDFFRIHRSTIVNLDCIESILQRSGGDHAVQLTDGTRLKVSRSRRDELKHQLGIDVLDGD
jgi:two-component system LytT family response regulator